MCGHGKHHQGDLGHHSSCDCHGVDTESIAKNMDATAIVTKADVTSTRVAGSVNAVAMRTAKVRRFISSDGLRRGQSKSPSWKRT